MKMIPNFEGGGLTCAGIPCSKCVCESPNTERQSGWPSPMVYKPNWRCKFFETAREIEWKETLK